MAPTELLAEQHYASLARLLGGALPIVLLTGSATESERRRRGAGLRGGPARGGDPRPVPGSGRVPAAGPGGGRRAAPLRGAQRDAAAPEGGAPGSPGDDGDAHPPLPGPHRLRRPARLHPGRAAARAAAGARPRSCRRGERRRGLPPAARGGRGRGAGLRGCAVDRGERQARRGLAGRGGGAGAARLWPAFRSPCSTAACRPPSGSGPCGPSPPARSGCWSRPR